MQAPKAPDPVDTATTQMGADVGAGSAAAIINNYDQSNPYAKVKYKQTGFDKVQAPDGSWIKVPTYKQTVKYKPGQQDLFKSQENLQQSMMGLATDQLGRLSSSLNTPFSLTGAPTVNTPSLMGGYNVYDPVGSFGGTQQPIQYGFGGEGDITGTHGPVNPITYGHGDAGAISGTHAAVSPLDYSIGPYGEVTSGMGPYGDILSTLSGNYGNVQTGRSGVGNIQSTFGGKNGITMGLDPSADVTMGRSGVGNIASGWGDTGNIQGSIGPQDWSDDRRKVEGAIMSRYDEMFGKQRDNLYSRLAAEGFDPNSEAGRGRLDELNRAETDARMQAILAGGQEQSRLAGLSLQQGQFANEAQQQAFTQAATRAGFQNAAQAQQYAQATGDWELKNQAQAQQFAQSLSRGQFENTAQGQAFEQAATRAGFANAAQAQQYAQATGDWELANQAQAQQYAQALSGSQFANNAQAQRFAQQLDKSKFANEAQAQQFAQAMGVAGFRSAAQAQEYAQATGDTQLANQAQAQRFTQMMADTEQMNAAQAQQYAQSMADSNLLNAAQQQEFEQAKARGEFQNDAQAREFTQNLAKASFYNQAQQQMTQNAAAQASFGNNAAIGQYNMDQQARDRYIQEQMMLRQLPLQEITSLMSGNAPTMPTFANPYQQAIQAPDMMGMYNNNYDQQMAYQRQMMSGLFGLGNTALDSFLPG